ncbi:MAG: 2'-5' RNA ligase [Gammaproteobacteria bacterium]|jgi:2'-5' RNA ligase|tara:strand:- start:932 stop:1465 length:534 start_codon:yes stop_codon:yes gene_type:complete
MAEPTQRLFFALWPSAELRAELLQAVTPMRDAAEGRLIPSENYHLTLAFLDRVPERLIPDVVTAAKSVLFQPIDLALDCYGVFEQPQVLWYGSKELPVPLGALVSELREQLAPLVKLRPERIFRPHVSVVRKQSQLPNLEPPAKLLWQASDFVLVHSEYGPGRANYTVMERFSAASV